MKIRCITLNLAGLMHGWRHLRRDAAVQQLKALRPDVLALQEVAIWHGEEGQSAYDQARDVAGELGLHFLAFAPYGNPIETVSEEEGGIALASRWPISYVRNRRLPSSHIRPPDARQALLVCLETSEGPLYVATTH